VTAWWRRLFGSTGPTAIARLTSGRRAVIRGQVVPRDLIESPLADEGCVYYRFLLEEFQAVSLAHLAGVGEGTWLLREEDEAAAEFYVDDGSGRVLVFPGEAVVESGGFVDRRAVGHNQRGTEWRIHAGDVVEITGIAEPLTDPLDPARGYRDAPTQLVLRGWGRTRLRIRVVERPTPAPSRNDSQ
jgi:hypothetical protein